TSTRMCCCRWCSPSVRSASSCSRLTRRSRRSTCDRRLVGAQTVPQNRPVRSSLKARPSPASQRRRIMLFPFPLEQRSDCRRPRRAPRPRLILEELEDRCLLSANGAISGTLVEDLTGNGVSADDLPIAHRDVTLFRDNGDGVLDPSQ